eukprot:TRINITY_DN95382_c0_g1_i1.p1 TRINITY_DN95382_c0_g1~~TRINITY_DN95382_c0_g1_i1.p1  ORF type:complete len:377 (+),score=83.56 TRINITY_DN95382_c0_g1_i1:78-1208(+)
MSAALTVEEQCTADEARRKVERPSVDEDTVKKLLLDHFGVSVEKLRELDSYDDQNFCVTSTEGLKYVFKVHNGVESAATEFLDALTAIFDELQNAGICAPVVVKTLKGEPYCLLEEKGLRHALRLLDWVEGDLMNQADVTPALEREAGNFLGRLRRRMDTLDLPGLHRVHMWDIRNTLRLENFLDILDDGQRALIERVLKEFRERILPLEEQKQLPWGTLMGDFNDANIILREGKVVGVIDFGDAIYSWRVNDVAIALAYAMITLSNPDNKRSGFAGEQHQVEGMTYFFQGVLDEYPLLTEAEVAVLPYLASCRLATSATLGWYSYKESVAAQPDMPEERRNYLLYHARPAWEALRVLYGAIDEGKAALPFPAPAP